MARATPRWRGGRPRYGPPEELHSQRASRCAGGDGEVGELFGGKLAGLDGATISSMVARDVGFADAGRAGWPQPGDTFGGDCDGDGLGAEREGEGGVADATWPRLLD